jgi:GH18 family chitinase
MGSIEYLNNDVKEKYPHLRTVVTFGGAFVSENFKNFLRKPDTLKKAAKGIEKVMRDYKFDGVDIDWEMPENSTESEYLLDFVEKIREYIGDDKILSLSVHFVPSNYYGYIKYYEPYLNWFNIMSYYYNGYWNKYSGFNSPLYKPSSNLNDAGNGDKSVDNFIKEGVPANKLVLGIPFFGQAWKVDSSSNNGYNQVGSTNVKGQADDISNSGVWTYIALRKEGIISSPKSPKSPWIRTWHTDAKTSSLYNPSTHIFISYDDVESMCERSIYAKNKKIGGVAVWEIGQDYKRELITSLVECYYYV